LAAGRANDATTAREAREMFVERLVVPLARGIGRRLERSGVAPAWLVAAAVALAWLAGVRLDAACEAQDREDGRFPLPGLDRVASGCGLVDAGAGTFTCDAGCSGSAFGGPSDPFFDHPEAAQGTTAAEKT